MYFETQKCYIYARINCDYLQQKLHNVQLLIQLSFQYPTPFSGSGLCDSLYPALIILCQSADTEHVVFTDCMITKWTVTMIKRLPKSQNSNKENYNFTQYIGELITLIKKIFNSIRRKIEQYLAHQHNTERGKSQLVQSKGYCFPIRNRLLSLYFVECCHQLLPTHTRLFTLHSLPLSLVPQATKFAHSKYLDFSVSVFLQNYHTPSTTSYSFNSLLT